MKCEIGRSILSPKGTNMTGERTDRMLLTYKAKRDRGLSVELSIARRVAEHAIGHRYRAQADVEHIDKRSVVRPGAHKVRNVHKARARVVQGPVAPLAVPSFSADVEHRAKLLGVPVDPACTSQKLGRCGLQGAWNGKGPSSACGTWTAPTPMRRSISRCVLLWKRSPIDYTKTGIVQRAP